MQIKLGKAIRRITVVKAEPTGSAGATILYDGQGKKKKQTWYLRPIERLSRRLAKAQILAGEQYLDLHQEANTRKRDGWKKRYGKNVGKVKRKVWKFIKR
ncbi:MAG: hypothetical protein QG599_451 [Pseudomonadota bacterium]|nr:hypothetical protein [Pseudomonadota bacterium]